MCHVTRCTALPQRQRRSPEQPPLVPRTSEFSKRTDITLHLIMFTGSAIAPGRWIPELQTLHTRQASTPARVSGSGTRG